MADKDVQETQDIPELAASPLRVAAFNIRIFGQKKMLNTNVTGILTKILQRYDLILIQEIRDKYATSLDNLLLVLNEVDPEDPFVSEVSERLGRSSSKEQYAFVYRPSKVTVVDTYQYDDGTDDGTDVFEREPYAVRLSCKNSAVDDFAIIAIHTSPSKAVKELNGLVHVWEMTCKHWGINDVIIAGDFNADGDFVSDNDWEKISLRSDRRFTWLIKDSADTTVGSTDCSYDRFVVTGKKLRRNIVPGSCKVFKFDTEFELSIDEAEAVSDHYPIELSIAGKQNFEAQKAVSTELSVVVSQREAISSVGDAREIYRAAQDKMAGFTSHVIRDGDRKAMLEVVAVKEDTESVVDALVDFHKAFPNVLLKETIGVAKAYVQSGLFDKPPYVYGLCTLDMETRFDVVVTCRLQPPFTCKVTLKKLRS